jgi:hypothetical protein
MICADTADFPVQNAKRKFVFFSFGIGSGPLGPVLFYGPPPLIVILFFQLKG